MKRVLSWAAVGVGSLLAAVVLALCFPKALFAHSLSIDGLTLHSDRPFSTEAGASVLKIALGKLQTSPLYGANEQHDVFICNARWRQRIFFTYVYGVGGVNYHPLTSNVFLRDADVESNRLIGPSGRPLEADRSLDYFIVHEVMHTVTGRTVGGLGNKKLPRWVREGYADYVAKGADFDYPRAVKALIADDRAMNYERSGLYLRYNLLVARLLDIEGWSVERLLNEAIAPERVEQAIRADVSVTAH